MRRYSVKGLKETAERRKNQLDATEFQASGRECNRETFLSLAVWNDLKNCRLLNPLIPSACADTEQIEARGILSKSFTHPFTEYQGFLALYINSQVFTCVVTVKRYF